MGLGEILSSIKTTIRGGPPKADDVRRDRRRSKYEPTALDDIQKLQPPPGPSL